MQKNFTKSFDWILSDKYRILFHFLFWIVIYSDEVLSLMGISDELGSSWTSYATTIISDLVLVYGTLYILLPQLLFKGKTVQFFVVVALLLFGFTYLSFYMDDFYSFAECSDCEPYTDRELISIFITSLSYTMTILGTAVGIKIFKEFARNQNKVSELETSNLQNELAYLKEQINPHFLFNALNNIYVLSRKRPKETPESILLLSDLLRYQLYDCSHQKVRLSGEIDYLKNYLELDKLRKSEADIRFDIIGEPNGKMVAPFVFVPFVENAIKHGTSIAKESFIHIKFDLSEENKIIFEVKNSKPLTPQQKLEGGIGLVNVQRRLDLLYPNAHELEMVNQGDVYRVRLVFLNE